MSRDRHGCEMRRGADGRQRTDVPAQRRPQRSRRETIGPQRQATAPRRLQGGRAPARGTPPPGPAGPTLTTLPVAPVFKWKSCSSAESNETSADTPHQPPGTPPSGIWGQPRASGDQVRGRCLLARGCLPRRRSTPEPGTLPACLRGLLGSRTVPVPSLYSLLHSDTYNVQSASLTTSKGTSHWHSACSRC